MTSLRGHRVKGELSVSHWLSRIFNGTRDLVKDMELYEHYKERQGPSRISSRSWGRQQL